MSIKRFFAVAMATTMVFGSTMTVFGDPVSEVTGTGTNTGHLDTDVFTAVLPTSVADGLFNFTIDPENILKTADKYTDGTTAAGATFVNDDLVYFKQATGADKAYASSSQTVAVGAKNYVDVDVSVEATVADAASGKTLIPMVSTAEELSEASSPALLLQLKVGDETGVITADGGSVVKKIAGQTANFGTKRQDDGSYKLVENADVTWSNNTADVQLVGKVKGGTVDADVVAPTVTLTWTVAKHVDAYVSALVVSTENKSLTLTLPTGVTVSEVVLNLSGNNVTLASGNQYSVSGTTITFTKYASSWAGGTLKVKYSDNHIDTITCQ